MLTGKIFKSEFIDLQLTLLLADYDISVKYANWYFKLINNV